MLRELPIIESARLGMTGCFVDLNNSIVQIKGHELTARRVRRPPNNPLIAVHGATSVEKRSGSGSQPPASRAIYRSSNAIRNSVLPELEYE